MRSTTTDRYLIAYALGALGGGLALLAEGCSNGSAVTAGTTAMYSVVGGAIATACRGLLGWFVPAQVARAGTLGAIACFGGLELLYSANVKLLPGEHYLSWRSLLADFAIVSPPLLGAVLLARAGWAGRRRERWARAGSVFGGALFVAGVAALFSGWPRATVQPVRHGRGPNLLLIVLDSVRRDRLPLPGSHPATPSLGDLARRGRAYGAAWASSSWTVPSVASILTPGSDSGSQSPTLGERLAEHGYATACFTNNPHLAQGRTVVRGFDLVERSVGSWRALLRDTVLGEVVERLNPGEDQGLTTRALRWASRQRGPFLLYVHLMDSHTPYRFPAIDGKERRGRRIEFPRSGMTLSAEETEDIVARYDGGVRSADRQVGRLLAAAPGWGRPFVAVVTSDHGESLGESGRWFHGHSLAPELLAIPLVLVGEGVSAGEVTTPVGHAAIGPTLLAAAGVPCSGCLDLRSQAGDGVVEGGLPPRLAYRIAGRYKVVLDRETGRRELFDWRADPREGRNLAGRRADLTQTLSKDLTRVRVSPRPTPESVVRLRSLGYAGF